MNTINNILGDDVSSIVYKYLTDDNKINHLRTVKFINKINSIFISSRHNNYLPSYINFDNKFIKRYYKWENNQFIFKKIIL
jgi:hypothetical protein